MNQKRVAGAMAIAAVAGIASAQVKYLVSDGDVLHRTDGGTTETFSLSGAHTIGMTMVPDGVVVAGAAPGDIIAVDDQENGNGRYNIYRIDNAYSGTPTLVTIGESNRVSNSLAFVGGKLYGVNGLNQQFRIHELSLLNFAGSNDVASGFQVLGIGGVGHDGTDFYFTDNGSNALYRYDLGSNTVTPLGPSGFSFLNQGMDFFGGEMLGAIEVDGGNLLIGEWDLGSGAFSSFIDVGPHRAGVTGFVALVPAPASLALLGVGGLVATRRRR